MMEEELKGKTVLVTGGTGSIGSEIVNQILDCKVKKVMIFSRDEIKHFLVKRRILDTRLETVVGDVRDYRSIQRVFEESDIDLIYHAAAMKHVVICEDFPIESAKTNIFGTQNVVDLALKYKIPKMVTISTDKSAYPVNVMGATKFIAERITLNANFSCVRFGNVANSRGSVIPVLIDNLLNKKPITITDPNVTRFIIGIPDAVKLVIKATEYAKGGEIFILKMKAFRLRDLLEVILDGIAPKLNISKEEVEVDVMGLVPGEKLHEDLINNTETNRVYELDGMYVILRNNEDALRYQNIKKIDLHEYTSKDTELISKDAIKDMVIEYLNTKYGFKNG
ncbi:NDP-sugar epimerase [Candidatus Methanophagaceae archaeon]|nr:NDP-sugar epimerase [Methanophagales archaeon]